MSAQPIEKLKPLVHVHQESIHMGLSFKGLEKIVREHFKQDPRSGDYFLFYNTSHTYAKLLRCMGNGFKIVARKLDTGSFLIPGTKSIDWNALKKLISGLDEDA